MALHLQLMAEKLAVPERQGGTPLERHLGALRDGIGKVDHLLRAFGEFAAPDHLPADLGAAVSRCSVLLAYEARRAGLQIAYQGPPAQMVAAEGRFLNDLVAHALSACIELAREGGKVELDLESRPKQVVLLARASGGAGDRPQALPHLEALRRLSAEAGCELSIDTPAAGGARLSLSFLHPR
jgi:hypothetical protein